MALLISTLLFVFYSGQARLVRATTEGGSGIHIIHGMSSSDSDDDEDYDEDFAFHDGKAASPPGMVTKNAKQQSMKSNCYK